jgi:hypothetical protein
VAKTIIITPASENIIRIPDGAPAECRLVISADIKWAGRFSGIEVA